MLVSSFNLLQSFNYTPYLFNKTVQIRDKFFPYMDHDLAASREKKPGLVFFFMKKLAHLACTSTVHYGFGIALMASYFK
jgi:hypothetical protein